MKLEEIKALMTEHGVTERELATEVAVDVEYMRDVLCAKEDLTEQFAKHIALFFKMRKAQMITYKINIPDAALEKWAPNMESLSETERVALAESIVRKTLADLAAIGAAITEEA